MESIIVNVSAHIANAFKNADEKKRRNVEIFINTCLDELFSNESANERLFKTMKKATDEAKANGFTSDMLNELLKDE